jgi:Carboxypeptidase regulatory-like domain
MRPLALIAFSAAALFAQSGGEIRGYAWDAEGRPLPQAKITLQGGNAKANRTLTAGADGSFDARGLQPGHYEITADSSQRQLTSESGIALDLKPGEIAHADLTLGKSTVHYGFWKRLGRRFVGLH